MSKIKEHLTFRYATKKFNPQLKVSAEQEQQILESINLTASSYGLQPYRVIAVRDQKLKKELVPFSYQQQQVSDADLLLVFAIESKVDEHYIDAYLKNICDTRHLTIGEVEGYGQMMKQSISSLPHEHQVVWAQKQAYIGLGTAMLTVASLGLDSCPMEGFSPADYDKMLGLEDLNLNSAVVLAVGTRSDEDVTQHYPKVRRSMSDFVIPK